MIPAPAPVIPLAAILVVAAGLLFYAAYKAAAGASSRGQATTVRRWGLSMAAVSTVLGLSAAGFLVNVLLTHGQNYDEAVFASLALNYGVQPDAAGESFTPGVPFAAVLDGQNVECTVNLPDAVVCAGEVVPLIERN